MKTNTLSRHPNSRQRGVVLFVALIVVVVMTLAGLALMRQMGAGTSIAGNVAFKESATSVGDLGVEEGAAWLQSVDAVTLHTTNTALGYYATWDPSVDPSTYANNWTAGFAVPASAEASAADAATGNSVEYVIHRLCAVEGSGPNDAGQTCSETFLANTAGVSLGGCSYSTCLPAPVPGPLYRITSRVVGPRNTVSYVQVVTN